MEYYWIGRMEPLIVSLNRINEVYESININSAPHKRKALSWESEHLESLSDLCAPKAPTVW